GEESYGFLVGDLVRDKDAVNACAFIAEMAAYFKSEGLSLFDVLLDLYRKYGFYQEKLISLTRKGKTGAEQIKQMMLDLRNNPPKTIGDVQIKEIRDYAQREATHVLSGEKTEITLPQSD